jgi:hypothetical protein
LGPEGWRISPAPTHDEELRETDIELLHDQFGTFHVEIKHCETEAIYWSEKEVDKAKQNPGCYVMVVLRRDSAGAFHEYWILDPLDELRGCRRTGIWEWRGRQEHQSAHDALSEWQPPAPRPEKQASFSFRVEIDSGWLESRGISFEKAKVCLQSRAPGHAAEG